MKKSSLYEKCIFTISVMWLIWVIFFAPDSGVPIGLICRQMGQRVVTTSEVYEMCVTLLNKNHPTMADYIAWVSSVALVFISAIALIKVKFANSDRSA